MKISRKPDHPDASILQRMVVALDELTERGGLVPSAIVADTGIDYPSLEYVAFQRAIRLVVGPSVTASDVDLYADEIGRCMAMYFEAFAVGTQWAGDTYT